MEILEYLCWKYYGYYTLFDSDAAWSDFFVRMLKSTEQIFNIVVKKHVGKDSVLNFVLENYDEAIVM